MRDSRASAMPFFSPNGKEMPLLPQTGDESAPQTGSRVLDVAAIMHIV